MTWQRPRSADGASSVLHKRHLDSRQSTGEGVSQDQLDAARQPRTEHCKTFARDGIDRMHPADAAAVRGLDSLDLHVAWKHV